MINLSNSSSCSLIAFSLIILYEYNAYFRYRQFTKDFVVYKLSNLVYSPVVVFFKTCFNTLSTRLRTIIMSLLYQHFLVLLRHECIKLGFTFQNLKGPYWTIKARNFNSHNPMFIPMNFLAIYFAKFIMIDSTLTTPVCKELAQTNPLQKHLPHEQRTIIEKPANVVGRREM